MAKIVLVVGGNAGAGKDTFAGYVAERLKRLDVSHRLDAYAATLKQIVHLKYGIPLHVLYASKQVKESTYFYGKSVRQILQEEGQYARQTCGRTIWADRVCERIEQGTDQVVIVTDARHPDEEVVGMRTRLKGARLFAARVVNPRVPVLRGHPSEDLIADAPDSIFDLLVTNDGSLEDLARTGSDVADAVLLLDQAGAKKITQKLVSYSAGADGWPYPSREDAEVVAQGKQIVARTLTHLRGSVVSTA